MRYGAPCFARASRAGAVEPPAKAPVSGGALPAFCRPALADAARRWARLVALEPAMHAEYGEDLRRAAELCDRAAAEADARREGADSVDTLSRPPPPPPPPNEEARDCVATRGGTRGGASASPAKEARARAGDVDDGDEREGESPKDTLGGVEETPAPAKKNAASVLPPAPPSTRACRRSGHPAAAAAGALASDVAGDAHGLTSPDGARAVACVCVRESCAVGASSRGSSY